MHERTGDTAPRNRREMRVNPPLIITDRGANAPWGPFTDAVGSTGSLVLGLMLRATFYPAISPEHGVDKLPGLLTVRACTPIRPRTHTIRPALLRFRIPQLMHTIHPSPARRRRVQIALRPHPIFTITPLVPLPDAAHATRFMFRGLILQLAICAAERRRRVMRISLNPLPLGTFSPPGPGPGAVLAARFDLSESGGEGAVDATALSDGGMVVFAPGDTLVASHPAGPLADAIDAAGFGLLMSCRMGAV
jgi:hypothetical protein